MPTSSGAAIPDDNNRSPAGYFNGNQTPPGPDMVNAYGLYDVIGNVAEWTRTVGGAESALDVYPQVENLTNAIHSLAAPGGRISRGGGYLDPQNSIALKCYGRTDGGRGLYAAAVFAWCGASNSYDTTFCGLPAAKAATLSMETFNKRARAARVAQAWCGVMMQFLALSNGLFAGGGSTASTSNPAPAICPLFKASASACSSINWPRLVFSRNAVGFIVRNRSAFTNFAVSGVSGQ